MFWSTKRTEFKWSAVILPVHLVSHRCKSVSSSSIYYNNSSERWAMMRQTCCSYRNLASRLGYRRRSWATQRLIRPALRSAPRHKTRHEKLPPAHESWQHDTVHSPRPDSQQPLSNLFIHPSILSVLLLSSSLINGPLRSAASRQGAWRRDKAIISFTAEAQQLIGFSYELLSALRLLLSPSLLFLSFYVSSF